jgi:hypothetical protein
LLQPTSAAQASKSLNDFIACLELGHD